MTKYIKIQYTCYIFGEGRKDRRFMEKLTDLPKFKEYYGANWWITCDNAHGCSARDILKLCYNNIVNYDYNLIICFIDIDDLKHDFSNTWQEEKEKLEQEYENINIIWQEENAEDEYFRVLHKLSKEELHKLSKEELHKLALNNIEKFINSKLWDKTKELIEAKEIELKKLEKK